MWKTMDESALKGKKVAELREIAKTFGLKNYQKMKKAELVQALMKDDEPPKKVNRPGEKKFQQNRITSWLGQIQQKQLRNRFMRSRQKRHQRTLQKLQQTMQIMQITQSTQGRRSGGRSAGGRKQAASRSKSGSREHENRVCRRE